MKKTILCLALCSLISGVAFSDVDVIDESQNFAFNDQAITSEIESVDDSVFVLSENSEQPTIKHDGLKEETGSSTMQLLLSKVETMQLEMAELRGMLEQQRHQLELAGVVKPSIQTLNQQAMVKAEPSKLSTPLLSVDDMQKKAALQTVEKADKAKEIKVVSSDPMDEQLSYVEAYEHVKHKRYQEAVPAMKSFIHNYPDGPYVANAHYWLGELYGAQGHYEQAQQEFKVVLTEFSDSMKVSSAQYKLGIMYEKLGKKELAQTEFVKVTEAFPGTAVARLAQARLKEIEG